MGVTRVSKSALKAAQTSLLILQEYRIRASSLSGRLRH
jgi:hypothetical protein